MLYYLKRSLGFVLAGVLLIAICLVLGVLIPRAPANMLSGGPFSGDKNNQILLLASDIHTDIAIPLNDTNRQVFAFLDDDLWLSDAVGAEWLILGWGGRSFYIETPTWSDLKPMPVFRAFTRDRSVMHVQLSGRIDQAHPNVQSLFITDAEMDQLRTSILHSFSLHTQGKPIQIMGAGYHDYSRFYEAEGAFNALIGCNIWTARMLRQAGMTTGLWTPLPQLLKVSLALHEAD